MPYEWRSVFQKKQIWQRQAIHTKDTLSSRLYLKDSRDSLFLVAVQLCSRSLLYQPEEKIPFFNFLLGAKYVQQQNNGCRVHKLHIDVILRKILQQ